jgi:iron complex outermembrane recepter protein
MKGSRVSGYLLGLLLCATFVTEAHAQIEEILVTAERRQESLSDLPQAISAFDRGAIESLGLDRVQDLQNYVPGLTFGESSNNARFSMRGVGIQFSGNATGDAGVAMYIDDVYISRQYLANGILNNLERIEVLRGPQGTLYGRNSTGGLIHLITREPSEEFELSAGAMYGNYDIWRYHASVSGPLDGLGEGVRGRVFHARSHQGEGFSDNLAPGGGGVEKPRQVEYSAALRIPFGDDVDALFRANYMKEKDTAQSQKIFTLPFGGAFGGTLAGSDTRKVYLNPEQLFSDFDTRGASLKVSWNVSDNIDFLSTTSYQDSSSFVSIDADGTDVDLLNTLGTEDGEQITQEFLISGDAAQWKWQAGVFYFREEWVGTFDVRVFGGPAPSLVNEGVTESFAVFGQATYAATDKVNLTLGARTTNDEKRRTKSTPSCDGFLAGDEWREWTGRAAIDYSPVDDFLLFASVSRGFRSGGYDPGQCVQSYDPEFVNAYEGGVKFELFDRRLVGSLTAFYYDYEDLQIQKLISIGVTNIENAADAEMKGVELEFSALATTNLMLRGSIAYLDATFQRFSSLDEFFPGPQDPTDLSGRTIPQSPEWKTHLGVEYSIPVPVGEIVARYDWSYSSEVFWDPFNRPVTRQKPYHMQNARLTYQPSSERWRVSGFVQNIGNEDILNKATNIGGGFNVSLFSYQAPRTYGVELAVDLGN